MNDEKFLLTLEVDGRNYPIRILRSEEEAYRKAARTIKNKLNQYRVSFGDSKMFDTRDFIAMIAIQAVAENFSLSELNNTEPFEKKITSLIKEMDDFLR